MIRKRFEEIKNVNVPLLKKSWKCNRICHFGKTAHPSGIINPDTGEPMTMCEFVARKIRSKGMNVSLAEDISEGHQFDYYEAPA